jgi:osmotically-inducible protein OsmY
MWQTGSRKTGKQLVAAMAAFLFWVTPAAGAERASPSDWRTASVVGQRVELEGTGVDRDEMEITVHRGVVTLTGAVETLAARDRVAGLARATPGVTGVVDRLVLHPMDREDGDITRVVRGTLRFAPALDDQAIGVAVQSGEVTLSGVVRSFVDKQLAESLTRGVAGVRGVRSDITVNPPAHRPDAEIEHDVNARLREELRVNTGFVTADVVDGTVRLEGYVADAASRELIELLGWVTGVRRVDGSALRVDRIAAAPERYAGLVVRSGRELERDIVEAIAHDLRLRDVAVRRGGARTDAADAGRAEIVVRALAGVVTLEGAVPSLVAWRAAERDAGNTPGVVGVVNLMTVDSQGGP